MSWKPKQSSADVRQQSIGCPNSGLDANYAPRHNTSMDVSIGIGRTYCSIGQHASNKVSILPPRALTNINWWTSHNIASSGHSKNQYRHPGHSPISIGERHIYFHPGYSIRSHETSPSLDTPYAGKLYAQGKNHDKRKTHTIWTQCPCACWPKSTYLTVDPIKTKRRLA